MSSESDDKQGTTKRQFQALLEHGADLTMMLDAAGQIRYQSPSIKRLLGYDPEEIVAGPPGLEAVHPDDRGIVEEFLTRVFMTPGLAARSRYRYRHHDGGYRTLEIFAQNLLDDPAVQGVVINGHDITERHEAEAALRESETRYKTFVELLPDALVVTSQQKVVFANPAAVQLFRATSQDQLLGRNVLEFVAREHQTEVVARATGERGNTIVPMEMRGCRLDGTFFPAEVLASGSTWKGQPARQAIIRDITERKDMTAKMMAVDRMIAVGTLAAGVGHEINNPLTYVIGNLEGLYQGLTALVESHTGEAANASVDLQELKRWAAEATDGARRIQGIVRDLKSFSRNDEEERLGPVDLTAVVEAAISMTRNEIRHRAQLVREFSPIPNVLGHDGRLRQVFLNLLTNAAHAIPEGQADANQICVTLFQNSSGVFAQVADSGSGVAPELVDRIFDPFFTTKPIGQGTGLGLTICRQIIEGHSGRIDIAPRPGGGTLVTVRLPMATRATPTGLHPQAPTGLKGARILVIDDEPLVISVLGRMLRNDFDVVTTLLGREGLQLILTSSPPFDLIVCDLMMPDLTGMDLYAAVESARPDLLPRFVFLTGGTFTPRAKAFVEERDLPVLEKPVQGDALRAYLNERLSKTR